MERKDHFGALLKKCSENTEKWVRPRLVDIELTNYCNLACKFCPTGQRSFKRPQGEMSVELAWKIARECAEFNIPVRFVRWGEPTIHPNFMGLVRLFKLAGVLLHINTNGIKLEPELILKEKVDSIKISLHSIASVKAARELIELRGDALKPYITVAYLDGELELDYEVEGADHVTHSGIKDLKEVRKNIPECWEVWNRISVDYDGKVTACCGDYDRKMTVGDLTIPGATLVQQWGNSKYRTYRNLVKQKAWDQLELCSRCARGV